MTKIERIISENVNITHHQSSDPSVSVEGIVSAILKKSADGKTVIIEDDGLVMIVEPESSYIARTHMFGETLNAKQIMKSSINITKYIFENTDINKLYSISPDKRFISLGKKTCWSYQGNLTKSYKNENGEFIDQYIVGVTREELNEYLRKLC